MVKLVALGVSAVVVFVIFLLFVFEPIAEFFNDIGNARRARKAFKDRSN